VPALGDEEDVGWFDVPVHDASRVGSIQRIGNLNSQGQHCFSLQDWPFSSPIS
jgi:hypothetical protein